MTDTLEHDAPLTTQGGGMRDFIEAVLGDQRGNVVMSLAGGRLPDGKPIVNRPRWFEYPKQIGMMVSFAEEHHEEDVYLSPIVYGDERGSNGKITRKKSNARTTQAIYMDSDACPPDAFRLPPSIHVQTSETHGHDYWLLTEPVPAPRAAEIAHRITTAHKDQGTDPSGWSASKFLRMPTTNLSYAEPFPIQWEHSGLIYSDLDVEGAYDNVQVTGSGWVDEPEADRPARSTTAARPAAPGHAPSLLDGEDLAPLFDRIPATNLRLVDLLEHQAKAGEKGWRSEQRWGLLLELMRAGFDDRETLSLAWQASATSKWREDARGVDGLWGEVVKARAEWEQETGKHVTPVVRERQVHDRPTLLLENERQAIVDARAFVQRYVSWAATRVPVLNRPLHEMNAWTYLSVCWAEGAHVWKPQGELPVNLYSVSIAESSTGKSEAAGLLQQALGAVYPYESPEIAVDQSKNALIENILLRDGAVAYAHSEEADATFAQQIHAPWALGVQQAWTILYDGGVPQQGRRQADKAVSKAGVKARVVMHHVGTPDALYDVLDRSLFKSGYMQRHIWTRGVAVPVTRESVASQRPGDAHTLDATVTPRYWADQMWRMRKAVAGSSTRDSAAVYFTEEAYDRIDDARWAIKQYLGGLGDGDIFAAMGNRYLDVLYKACALTALSEGRTLGTVRDVLIGIAAVEHWLDTAVGVVESIASSAFSRSADEIERFIAGREGREAEASRIYGLMKGVRPREVDEFLDSLVKQGRLEPITPKAGGPRRFKYKGTEGGTK